MDKIKLRRLTGNFGKLILDAAKLSFGSLVLETIIKGEIAHSALLIAGIIVSSAGAVAGLILISFYEV